MNENAILYALSTLAQTCAALAAFLGAVWVFRLQSIDQNRERILSRIAGLLNHPAKTDIEVIEDATRRQGDFGEMPDALARYNRMTAARNTSIRWFSAFEVGTLLIIFLSLIGFAFVPQLACHPILTAITFGVLSAGAVCITMVAFWNGFGFEGIWPGRWSTRITRTIDAWKRRS